MIGWSGRERVRGNEGGRERERERRERVQGRGREGERVLNISRVFIR